jgi:hypothetical protein
MATTTRVYKKAISKAKLREGTHGGNRDGCSGIGSDAAENVSTARSAIGPTVKVSHRGGSVKGGSPFARITTRTGNSSALSSTENENLP